MQVNIFHLPQIQVNHCQMEISCAVESLESAHKNVYYFDILSA